MQAGPLDRVSLQSVKANENDFDGELEIGLVNPNGSPAGLPGMPYTLAGLRPAAFPRARRGTSSPRSSCLRR